MTNISQLIPSIELGQMFRALTIDLTGSTYAIQPLHGQFPQERMIVESIETMNSLACRVPRWSIPRTVATPFVEFISVSIDIPSST